MGVYKEAFLKEIYKMLSAAHLQNKSQKIMSEQTLYIKVLAQVLFWFSAKYSGISSYVVFLWEDYGSLSLMDFAEGSWR